MSELKLIKRDELKPEDGYKVNIDKIDNSIKENKKYITSKSIDELKVDEEYILDELNKYDKVLSEVVYPLQDSVEFKGKKYSRKVVSDKLRYFVNKNTVEFKFTLGMYELIQLWKDDNVKEIHYKPFDSTLRILDQVKFTGETEWTDILIVNEYLSLCHESYQLDTAYMYYLSNIHNDILDAMKVDDIDSGEEKK